MIILIVLNVLLPSSLVAFAQTQTPEYNIDPYLQYRPPFARSLPIQILLTGIVFTLVAVLFIHLILTSQYHWPLAPANYVLQLSGVCTLLISLIATLHVVLSATFSESEKWPYMLSYIAVNVPPLELDSAMQGWTPAERAMWLVMNASTSGLIQITHIQFLTLLYPSRLEGRLIFTLLGPLAILAAVMQLLPMSASPAVIAISSAVRNVCNATLSLLFTAALFIWGFLVNRKQAWRTDGGTAVFGCAAIFLAVVSTGLNFLYVPREEEYVWLPSLMWAVVLWQSFLGWWWWVGAGSGAGLVEEDDVMRKIQREAKREMRRKEARQRRRDTKQRAKNVLKGVAGALAQKEGDSPTRGDSPPAISHVSQSYDIPTTRSFSDSNSTTAATVLPISRFLPAVVQRWYASLRHAHQVAARRQAVERVERIRGFDRNETHSPGRSGWGLGSFGWRLGTQHDRTHVFELQSTRQRRDAGSETEPSVDGADDTFPPVSLPQTRSNRPQSIWWWGPLSQWRLRDSTTY